MPPSVERFLPDQDSKRADYLEHIDGIRCIAVTAVLLFHLGFQPLSGGYVGVDVFFVISGFLITKICTKERFSYKSFFLGRARRILPAYFFWLVISCLAAIAILLPTHLYGMGISLIASPLFLQNFAFWKQINYFEVGNSNPILHTWSLAVEWQFYLVYPILIAPFRNNRKVMLFLLLAICAVSFSLCVWSTYYKPMAAFYLTPFRVWEFVIGGLVSFLATRTERRFRDEVISILGVIAILWACFAYDDRTLFPGFAALLPCVGTAALIHGGLNARKPFVQTLISCRPMGIVGKASYSIYLVHWPILVFTGYFYPLGRPAHVSVLCLAASLALGIASWLAVEAPFRKPGRISLRAKYGSAFAAMTATLLIGVAVFASSGFPGRFSPHVAHLAQAEEERGRFRSCLGNAVPKSGFDGLCLIGASGKEPSFLVWGDSLADALLEGLDQTASSAGIAGAFIGTDACPPLLGFDGLFQPSWARCRGIQDYVPKLLRANKLDAVFLAGSWARYESRDPALFRSTMDATFSMLRDLRSTVLVFGVIPDARANVPVTMAKEAAFGIGADIEMAEDKLKTITILDGLIENAVNSYALRFINVKKYICQPRCRTHIDGKPLYFDDSHFSPFGSQYVIQSVMRGEATP